MATFSVEGAALHDKNTVLGSEHGRLAVDLAKVYSEKLVCPDSIVLPFQDVVKFGNGELFDIRPALDKLGTTRLLSVIPSPADPAWGGPKIFTDVGLNDELHLELSTRLGREAADQRYLRHILNFGETVARLDPDQFEPALDSTDSISSALDIFEQEAGEPFPQDASQQLSAVLIHMARAWNSVSSRILREAMNAPSDAALALIIQDYFWSTGERFSGSGEATRLDASSGEHRFSIRFNPAVDQTQSALDAQGDLTPNNAEALGRLSPGASESVAGILDQLRRAFREEVGIEFSVVGEDVLITHVSRLKLEARAAIHSAVSLAEDGIISQNEALLRVNPNSLIELLHPSVDEVGGAKPIFSGVPASPGGASGHLAFSSSAALEMASMGKSCILVRRETSPEDVRGLVDASGIVTERGGATSHAAVIARGLGVPCVTGASDIKLSPKEKILRLPDGSELCEGDLVTIDGTTGKVFSGVLPTRGPAVDDSFRTLMSWADDVRTLGVRANADTPNDAEQAGRFKADGIGLCRTEHMFFEPSRMIVMREMIFAENESDRRRALDQLLPMQRSDFVALYETMAGKPVCIRLFDPPLHEFLPVDREGQLGLAEALDIPVSQVVKRVEALSEYNPMLGLRGVRLGITVPEIYDMQVRAIMEASVEASRRIGPTIVPEIMIPLISTVREVSIVKKRMDAVAADIQTDDGSPVEYRLGVLLETPRAILRAEDIAEYAEILSFGTNDLTQMSFGISRDDVGRFIGQYIDSGAFEFDPFNTLDIEGVGELIQIGADRGRAGRPDMVLTLCGEHAGEVNVIRFCEKLGFRYVSCSPFRVPIAKVAAAQLAIQNRD